MMIIDFINMLADAAIILSFLYLYKLNRDSISATNRLIERLHKLETNAACINFVERRKTPSHAFN